MFFFPLLFHQTCETTVDNKNLLDELRKCEEWEKVSTWPMAIHLFECRLNSNVKEYPVFKCYDSTQKLYGMVGLVFFHVNRSA